MSSISTASAPAASPVDERPWQVAAGIGLAGALIVALAFPAAGRLAETELPRRLGIAAVVLAVLTVAAGMSAVVLRSLSRGRSRVMPAVAAGLLLAATALAGAAAVALLADGPAPAPVPREGLTVSLSGLGEDAHLTVQAEVPDVAAGALVRAEVTATPDEGDGVVVLAKQLTVARTTGTVSVDLEARTITGFSMVQILVESPARRCTASIRPLESEDPVVSCKPR